MADKVSIRNKFTELSAKYATRHIDDFETFVCARVADYYINNEHASTDTIFTKIEEALREPIAEETVLEESGDSPEKVDEYAYSYVPPPPPTPLVSLPKKLLKAVPYIAGAGAAVIGIISWAAKRQKRK